MKNLILFLKIGRILFGALLVGQIIFVFLTNKDLFSFYEYPKTLTFILMIGFGYALEKAVEYGLDKPVKNKKKPQSDSHL